MLWNLIFVNALSTMTSILWVIFCFIVVLCGLVSQILALWVCFQHIFAYIWSVLDTALSKKKYEIFSLILQCETINQHHLHIFQLQKLQLQNLMNSSVQGLILASPKHLRGSIMGCYPGCQLGSQVSKTEVLCWSLAPGVHSNASHQMKFRLCGHFLTSVSWTSAFLLTAMTLKGEGGGHFDDAKIQPNVSSIPHHPPHKSLAQACTGSARHLPPPRSWVAQRAKNALGQVGQVNFEHGRQWQSILASW